MAGIQATKVVSGEVPSMANLPVRSPDELKVAKWQSSAYSNGILAYNVCSSMYSDA